MKFQDPDKQDVDNPRAAIIADEVEDEAMDEAEDDELDDLDNEGFQDEAELSAVNEALDNINDALDKLEEQNDQLNEQLRSILEASQRIQSGLSNAESFGNSST